MNKGIITSIIADNYTIYDYSLKQTFNAKLRGIFRKQNITPKVGDRISYSVEQSFYVIEDIMPRKNDLIRPAICNIDQAFVIFSVKEPDLNLNLLDKFLTILSYNNIEAVIIFTKWDLLSPQELKTINEICTYYQKIGYKIFKTTTKNKQVDQDLLALFSQKVSVFTGQSGVGKSSLLNMLDEALCLPTNQISKALGRGKHTTRFVKLYELYGGFIADTPGFGNLNFTDLSESDIADNFVDFFALKSKCKYNTCLHLNEPDCAVKKAVEAKEILESRYLNYQTFITDLRKEKNHDYRTINLKHPNRTKK